MKSFQALRSPAIPLTSFHDLLVLISSSIGLRHVLFGLPLLLYPWGFHSNAVFSIAPAPLHNVCPIQLHFLLFIWISIGFCLVILHNSLFVILLAHFIFIIRLKHLFINSAVMCCAVVWCDVLCCAVMCCAVVWCDVMWCAVVWYAVLCSDVMCCGVMCCDVICCDVMWCDVVWCGVICCAVQWCDVLWCGVMCCTVLWCAVLWCGVMCCGVICCGVMWCAVQCCDVLCSDVLWCDVMCCDVLCCSVMCCDVMCRAVLCCAVLCFSVNKQLTVFRNFFCLISRLCKETAKRDFLIWSVPASNTTRHTTVFIGNHQQRLKTMTNLIQTWFILQYVYNNRLHVSSIICSSSWGWIVLLQHLVSSHSVSGRPVHRLRENCVLSTCKPDGHLLSVTIPDVAAIQFNLLMMSI